MSAPVQVDLPHKLGAAEAKRRIDGGIGRLRDLIPGGAEVRSAWTGDSLGLHLIQEIAKVAPAGGRGGRGGQYQGKDGGAHGVSVNFGNVR